MDKDHRLSAVEWPGLESVSLVQALCEQGTTLWVGTNIGLFAVDPSKGVRQFTKERDGLPANSIQSLAVDSRNRLWIGLGGGGGVLRYDGGGFHSIWLARSMEENTVGTTLCDQRGRLWFGTWGGLIRYRPRQTPPGLLIRQVVEGRLLDAHESLFWPEGAPELALHFQGIQFRAGGAGPMHYCHRLVGRA